MKLRPVANPPNPYLSEHREWLEPPPEARVEVYEETASSILSKNDSPDLPFRWSVNPYRGCQHACAYCYARPYHEFLGYGAGTDFDTKLIVKVNAADLLRKAFRKRSWSGELVNFSGVTDCYQPIEASYKVMRSCLSVCAQFANPVGIVTKGFLVVRDIDLLLEIDDAAQAVVFVSVPTMDEKVTRFLEPQAPSPRRRIEALRRLAQAGLRVGVFVSPVIPGLTDRDVTGVLEAAKEAGVTFANYTALRLPGSVESVFFERLREAMPDRARRVEARVRDIRSGGLDESRFGARMRGEGAYWEAIVKLFNVTRRRLGLESARCEDDLSDAPSSGLDDAESDRGSATLPYRRSGKDRAKRPEKPAQLDFGF